MYFNKVFNIYLSLRKINIENEWRDRRRRTAVFMWTADDVLSCEFSGGVGGIAIWHATSCTWVVCVCGRLIIIIGAMFCFELVAWSFANYHCVVQIWIVRV